MVTTILTDICRAFPGLTPEAIWSGKTESQMMLYYRSAKRHDNEQTARWALVSRMAVATAIVNTIAGKDVPEFADMVSQLVDDDREEKETKTMPASIPDMESAGGSLEGFKEF